jgi:hypothetical protein
MDFVDSRSVLGDPTELKRRIDQDGYLYFTGLLPREPLEAVRLAWLEIADQHGWLLGGQPRVNGVTNPEAFCLDPEPIYRAVKSEMYRLEALHALPHMKELVGLFTRLLSAPVFSHPRLIARVVFPSPKDRPGATGTLAHQDYRDIQGSPETYTAWIPLDDCPRERGGLTVAVGSHKSGLLPVHLGIGQNAYEVDGDFDAQWATTDYRQGDVVVFHSHAVHKAPPNLSDGLRLSFDCRFQRVSDPVMEQCLASSTDWEDVYRDWTSRELAYYWKNLSLHVIPYDPTFRDNRDKLAFEAAELGDMSAISTLQRIATYNPDQGIRDKAKEYLRNLGAPLE